MNCKCTPPDGSLFAQVRFVLAGFDSTAESQFVDELEQNGGHNVGLYDATCTHIIVSNLTYDDPICAAARKDGKGLVTDLWVTDCLDSGTLCDVDNVLYRPLKDPDGIPGSQVLCLCLTGYQGQARRKIMIMVEMMGAKFTKPLMANMVTHLICYKFEGDKYEMAKRTGIKLVNHHWLEDCLKLWALLPESSYSQSGAEAEAAAAAVAAAEVETEAEAEVEVVGEHFTRRLTDSLGQSNGELGPGNGEDVCQNGSEFAVVIEGDASPHKNFSRRLDADTEIKKHHLKSPRSLDAIEQTSKHPGYDGNEYIHGKSVDASHNPYQPNVKINCKGRDSIGLNWESGLMNGKSSGDPQSHGTQRQTTEDQAAVKDSYKTTHQHESSSDSRDLHAPLGQETRTSGDAGKGKATINMVASKGSPQTGVTHIEQGCTVSALVNDCVTEGLCQSIDPIVHQKTSKSDGSPAGTQDWKSEDFMRTRKFSLKENIAKSAGESCTVSQNIEAKMDMMSRIFEGRNKSSSASPPSDDKSLQACYTPGMPHGEQLKDPSDWSSSQKKTQVSPEAQKLPQKHSILDMAEELPKVNIATVTKNSVLGLSEGQLCYTRVGAILNSIPLGLCSPVLAVDCAGSQMDTVETVRDSKVVGTANQESTISGLSLRHGEVEGEKKPQEARKLKRKMHVSFSRPYQGSKKHRSPVDNSSISAPCQITRQRLNPVYAQTEPVEESVKSEDCDRNTKSLISDSEEAAAKCKKLAVVNSTKVIGRAHQSSGTNRALGSIEKHRTANGSLQIRKQAKEKVTDPFSEATKRCREPELGELQREKSSGAIADEEMNQEHVQGDYYETPDTIGNDTVDIMKEIVPPNLDKGRTSRKLKNQVEVAIKQDLCTPGEIGRNVKRKKLEKHWTANGSHQIRKQAKEKVTDPFSEATKRCREPELGELQREKSSGAIANEEMNQEHVQGDYYETPDTIGNDTVDIMKEIVPPNLDKGRTSRKLKNQVEVAIKQDLCTPGEIGRNVKRKKLEKENISEVETSCEILSVSSKGMPTTPFPEAKKVGIIQKWFALGSTLEKQKLQSIIKILGGKVCKDQHQWKDQATHVVLPAPLPRTEKFLAGAAAGRWILKPEYLEASREAGKFLEEEAFEWYGVGTNDKGNISLDAPRKWRIMRETTGCGAFHGLRVIVYGECTMPPLDTLKRALKAGGGNIVAANPPYSRHLNDGIDFAVLNPDMPQGDPWVAQLLRLGIACVSSDYFVDFICHPTDDGLKHVLFGSGSAVEAARIRLKSNIDCFASDYRRGTTLSSGKVKQIDKMQLVNVQGNNHEVTRNASYQDDDISCSVCGRTDGEEVMLLCGDGNGAGCGLAIHTHCCVPPLDKVPVEDWFCEECLRSKPRS